LLVAPLAAAAATARPGVVDHELRSGIVDLPPGLTAAGVIVEPDGRLVVAAAGDTVSVLLRYTRDGVRDRRFGHRGKAVLPQGMSVAALQRESDGKLVAAGTVSAGKVAVARFDPDGSVDRSFGRSGETVTTLGPDTVSSLVVQRRGRLVVGGTRQIAYSHSVNQTDFALVCLTSAGGVDRSFGRGGEVRTMIGPPGASVRTDSLSALVTEPDGKVVGAGVGNIDKRSVFALARYNTDGSLDPSFGLDGKAITTISSDRIGAAALVRQPDGRLVTAGGEERGAGVVVRLNRNGSLDTTFGKGGKATIVRTAGVSGYDVLLRQHDGKLVAGGAIDTLQEDFFTDIRLVRYDTNGVVDRSFGRRGQVTFDLGPDANNIQALVQQQGGKLIIAASDYDVSSDTGYAALVRFKPDGSLDRSFGTK
jgi:uncharacterized delta-60 repeat protein